MRMRNGKENFYNGPPERKRKCNHTHAHTEMRTLTTGEQISRHTGITFGFAIYHLSSFGQPMSGMQDNNKMKNEHMRCLYLKS